MLKSIYSFKSKKIITYYFLYSFIALSMLVTASCGSSSSQAEEQKEYMHFFVLPTTFPDGSSTNELREEFKVYIASLAGGYTELGLAEGGWVNPENILVTESSYAFMVSANSDLTEVIRAYLIDNFKQQAGYVKVWQVM